MRTLYRLVYRRLIIRHCCNSRVTGVRSLSSNGTRYQTLRELQATEHLLYDTCLLNHPPQATLLSHSFC
jgi:hypothetical protein